MVPPSTTRFAPGPTCTLPVTVVPLSEQDLPSGTNRSVGRVTAPPLPTQYVTRSALALGAASTTDAEARALMASAVAVRLVGITVLLAPLRKLICPRPIGMPRGR